MAISLLRIISFGKKVINLLYIFSTISLIEYVGISNNSLYTLYQVNNGATIISWLDMLKTYNSTDGKIPGLLNSSKIQINTTKKDGAYNLILLWIKNNMDKFTN